ncbi:MAG TPA: gamma-glutamyltransferase family protein [Chloroflexota bacterium]
MSLTNEQIMTHELRGAERGTLYPSREPAMARGGMAGSAHPFASQTATDVLRHGGNAVDAAVAAAAVLMTVEPRNGHLGGETFMQVGLPDGRVVAINGSGAAPAAATLEQFRALGAIPESGLLAATVPGTISAWSLALERFGTRSLADLLRYAVEYAEQGVPVTPRLHRLLDLDAPTYRRFPSSAAVFLPGGRVPEVGETLPQPALARSLKRIADGGREEFYTGELAREMVAFSGEHGGIFSLADFAEHQSEELPPVRIDYRGYAVCEQPPVSQGLVVLLALRILEQFSMSDLRPGSAEALHLQIEAYKLAFEDRLRFMGDPRFVDIPIQHLLSDEHARDQARRLDRRRARMLAVSSARPDTTSMCVADASGMMVAYIHSLYAGCGVVMGDTGVLMNGRMQAFQLDPRSPDCLAPGKRPVHTLNTFLVQKNGHSVLVGGTPGAHWQVQTNLQVLNNVLDWGMDVDEAIVAPRFTLGEQLTTGNPVISIEGRVDGQALSQLEDLGHDVQLIGPWESGGAVQLIARDPATGVYRGATEIRRSPCTILGF